jgi:hypothetical protein
MYYMDKTIRNLKKEAYLAIRAKAVLKGKNIGEMISEAIEKYLALPEFSKSSFSIQDLSRFSLGRGNKKLSSQIDSILYDK